ncbi:MAG: two-component regulator propeller domain-containing protein [Acidobacteriota bacterium]
MGRVITILILFFFTLNNFGQQCNFRNYGIEHGLAKSHVTAIIEDSGGYKWFGTNGEGVSRFNGLNFESFGKMRGLVHEVVTSILEDSNKNIWVGTHSGVHVLDGSKFKYMTPANGFPATPVTVILERKNNEIWFATKSEGIIINKNGKNLRLNTDSGFIDNEILSLYSESNEITWIGTGKGLIKHSGNTSVKINIPGLSKNSAIQYIKIDSLNRLWIGSSGGLFFRNKNRWKKFTLLDGLLNENIHTIHEGSDKTIRIGTDKGLSVFKNGRFITYTTKEGLVNNYVTQIIEDSEKNFWIGTNGGVTQILPCLPVTSYTTTNNLKNNFVNDFFEEDSGNIWISTVNGINLFSPETGKITKANLPYSDKTFSPIFKDKLGVTWVCFEKNIVLLKDNRIIKEFNNREEIFSKFSCIFQDKTDMMWLGTINGGILIYDGTNFRQLKKEDGLPGNNILTISEDKNGVIWIGTDQGLIHYKENKFFLKQGFEILKNISITKIIINENGESYIGTPGNGIFLIDHNENKKINEIIKQLPDLPDMEINSMITDNSGNLWFGTNNGIFMYESYDHINNAKYIYQPFTFDKSNRGVECNQNSVLKDSKGNIWFGTKNGAVRIKPEKTGESFQPSRTHITEVSLFLGTIDISQFSNGFNHITNLPQNLTLPYKKNHVTFRFIGISSTFPQKVKYRWKLEPYDSKWSSPSEQNQISYSNLSPDNYKFYVKSSIDQENWDFNPEEFTFRILAPYWMNKLFILFVIVSLLTVFYFFFRLKSISAKKRDNDLEKRVAEKTQDLMTEKNKCERAIMELEKKMSERSKELEIKTNQLIQAQKMEVIGSLAGGVAHDLNNILTGVVSYPDLLLRNIEEDDPNKKYVEIIKKSGEKAAEMVQDLLTLTRKGILNKENISINDIIRDFFESPEFNKIRQNTPNISIKTNLSGEQTTVFGSSIHITKAIMNLISNSAEAMPIEGVIEIGTESCYLNEPIKGYYDINKGRYIKISISDTGIGIDESDIENIFEPFFSKKRLGRSGTGLGMTVVWWTVKDHTGYIEVKSKKGEGTRFNIFIPASDEIPEIQTVQPPPSEISFMGNREHILIIEDDPDNRKFAEIILKELNYNVSSVNCGEEAVEFVKNSQADLLILDMIMDPGMNGLETYIEILKLKGEQKAIITSGYSESEDVKETLKLGAGKYIKKPYLRIQLARAVRAELDKILQ